MRLQQYHNRVWQYIPSSQDSRCRHSERNCSFSVHSGNWERACCSRCHYSYGHGWFVGYGAGWFRSRCNFKCLLVVAGRHAAREPAGTLWWQSILQHLLHVHPTNCWSNDPVCDCRQQNWCQGALRSASCVIGNIHRCRGGHRVEQRWSKRGQCIPSRHSLRSVKCREAAHSGSFLPVWSYLLVSTKYWSASLRKCIFY